MATEARRRWYEKNRERILAQQKQQYAENSEAILAKQKQYYEKNREQILAKQKAYRDENREELNAKHRERSKREYKEHPEKVKARIIKYNEKRPEAKRASVHNLRAKQYNGGTHSGQDERDIFSAQEGRCFYCDTQLKTGNRYDPRAANIDHILAVDRCGANTAFNIVYSCDSCNHKKQKNYDEDALALLEALADNGTITTEAAELKKSVILLSRALNDNLVLRLYRAEAAV